MKRNIAFAIALALILGGAVMQASAQPTATFDEFKTAFVDFSDALAGTLNLNSTIGNTWSDGWIGGFPHFGAGLALGYTFAGKDASQALVSAIGQTLPSELENLGVPIPAVAATAKIGLPFLPVDVGLKAGIIPQSVGDKLEGLYGVKTDYKNVGISLRGALVKEKLILPEISLGVSGNYLTGKVSAPVGSSQQLTVPTGESLTFTQPNVALEWETKTLDLNLQVSKKILLILTPYAGVGYTIGSSDVKGGLQSSYVYNDGGTGTTEADFLAALESQGYDVSSTGFLYSTTSKEPTFRIYGGLSLNILVALDLQMMYVPATKNLGGSLTARIQL